MMGVSVSVIVLWEAHLIGVLAGLLLAVFFRKALRHPDHEEISEDSEDQNNVSTTGDGIYQYHYKPENQVKKNN